MSSSLISKLWAQATRLLSTVTPDWLQSMVFGLPMARELVFAETEMPTRKGGRHVVPAAWLKPGAEIAPRKGRRFVDVLLPSSQLLRREVRLPKAPRRALENAVALDMLRKTPFKPGQTYAILADIKRSDAGVSLTHWVARREDIDRLRSALSRAGLVVRRVLVADEPGTPLVDFGPQAYPQGRLWRWVNLVSLLAMLGFGGWMWARPTLAVQDALKAQQAELARMTQEALQLRQQIEAQSLAASERAAFLDRMTRRTTAIATLREATVVMPDPVWLTDLGFDQSRVTMGGTTAGSAAQTLLDLPDNALLRDPELAGPVSQSNDGRERFDIVFQLSGRAR